MDTKKRSLFFKRLGMTLGGVVVCAFSVGMFKRADFGVDPFQCFAQGLHIPLAAHISYGTFYLLLSILFLIAVFFLDKHYVGLATVINMFGTGYVVDASYGLLCRLLPQPSMGVRVALLVGAVVIMCVGSALYFTSNLGVSVYDAISLSLADRKPKVRGRTIPFKFIRVTCDCICVLIGFLFGMMPGLGTLVTAFFMGPLIDFFNRNLAIPLLYGRRPIRKENVK